MEGMDIDLSIVKEERIELEDYGQNEGNILDNFIADNEFDIQDSVATVPCVEEEDVNVDWLSNFFDEPIHDNMSGLNPPLTDIISSTNHTHSISKLSSFHGGVSSSENILLDSYSTFTEDYINSNTFNDSYGLKSILPKSPTLIHSVNPLLSQTNNKQKIYLNKDKQLETELKENIKDEILIKFEDDTVKVNKNESTVENIESTIANSVENSKNTVEFNKTTVECNKTIDKSVNKQQPLDKQQQQQAGQQKLLLFMNTPENRAKLAGTNFNIINANLLSKISTQGNQIKPQVNKSQDKPLNVVNVKRCFPSNNNLFRKDSNTNTINVAMNNNKVMNNGTLSSNLLLRKDKVNLMNELMQSTIMQTIIKKENENHEVDSGYESPTNSFSSSPLSPPIDIESTDKHIETLHYIDIPPHERQPFYLSEEEKRTLLIEGLPIPARLPLNKMEERALKKVRRKIKNKISAQESRRKKKEYMEALEKKVDNYASENNGLKKKVGGLELANRSLIMQVQKLQALVAQNVKSTPSNNIRAEDMES